MDRATIELLRGIRRDANSILGDALTGHIEPIGATAAGILTRIANFEAAIRMAEESTAPDRYDLSTLPPPVAIDSEDDTESPDFAG